VQERVFVIVREEERERERERERTCLKIRRICVIEGESERERDCVCERVRERERDCVCERVRERERERERGGTSKHRCVPASIVVCRQASLLPTSFIVLVSLSLFFHFSPSF